MAEKNPDKQLASPRFMSTSGSSSSLSATRPQNFRIFTRLQPVHSQPDSFEAEPLSKEKYLPKPDESDILESWKHYKQQDKVCLGSLLKARIQNNVMPNIQVRIGYFTFHCHLLVLRSYSRYFKDIGKRTSNVTLPRTIVSEGAFAKIYSWMLTSKPRVECKGIVALFKAALHLGVGELIQQCWQCFEDRKIFREAEAYITFLQAKAHQILVLQDVMLARTGKFFLVLLTSKDFEELTAREICILLKSDQTGVNSEIEIFMSAVLWFKFDEIERENHLLDLLRCVRFSLMPDWYLRSLLTNAQTPDINRIIDNPHIRSLVEMSLRLVTARNFYGEGSQLYKNLVSHFEIKPTTGRDYIYDGKCKYHHRIGCPNWKIFSFQDFENYLQNLVSLGTEHYHTFQYLATMQKDCCICTKCAKAAKQQSGDGLH